MSETDYNYDTHLERLRERVMEADGEIEDESVNEDLFNDDNDGYYDGWETRDDEYRADE